MEGNEEGGAEEKRSAHVQRSLNRGKWLPDAGTHRRFRTMEKWLSSLVLSLLKRKTYEISLVKKRLILNRSTASTVTGRSVGVGSRLKFCQLITGGKGPYVLLHARTTM